MASCKDKKVIRQEILAYVQALKDHNINVAAV